MLQVSENDRERLRKKYRRKLFFMRFKNWWLYQKKSWKRLFRRRK